MNQSPETGPLSHLYGARRRLIACAVVIEEMLPFLPADVPYEVLEFGLHLSPAKLRAILQEKIDEASQLADVLLLGYGLCAMAVVGLKTTSATLVIPRVDDCIALFLGSRAARRAQAQQEPGTYYLTKGWIEVGDSPFEEYKLLVTKYGEAKAMGMMKLTLENYTRLGFINTGQYDIERYRHYAHRVAEQFDLRYEEIEGSPALVKKMIFGPWDEEFVVIPPGRAVRYEDFVPGS